MNSLTQDFRYALRTMRLNPGFTIVAMLALALGIGANTAIFTVVNAVLLRPLPYPDANRIVALTRIFSGDRRTPAVSGMMFDYWKRNAQAYKDVAAFDVLGSGVNLSGAGDPERVKSIRVTPSFFRVLDVSPLLGRNFTDDEAKPNGPALAIISNGLWKRMTGSSSAVILSKLMLNGAPHTVIGVMPPQLTTQPSADIFLPLSIVGDPSDRTNLYSMIARLKDGVSLEQAIADSQQIEAHLRIEHASLAAGMDHHFGPTPYQRFLYGDLRPSLLILLAAVAAVLLIACTNVANLLLARAAARSKELAVRAAMGASRGRIIRQLLSESVVLGFSGAIAGLVLAHYGLRALLSVLPGDLPEMARIETDASVLLFTLVLAVLTSVLFGMLPAIDSSKLNLTSSLKESSRGSSTSLKGQRVRAALVVSEVALCLVLLVGASLLLRSFIAMRNIAPGFDEHNVLTMQLSLSADRYQKTAPVADFARRAMENIERLPGVQAAALMTSLPLEPGPDLTYDVEGKTAQTKSGRLEGDALYRAVTPHAFVALGVPLKSGRVFDERDRANSQPVVIINEYLAKLKFKNHNPIGERITFGRQMGPQFHDEPRTIVGIVGDVREQGLDNEVAETVYIPLEQQPDWFTSLASKVLPMSAAIRTGSSPLTLTEPVKRAILQIDSLQPAANVNTLEQILQKSTGGRRFMLVLIGAFASLAFLLSVIGIYGVLSYTVTQRAHEIGIRMALGAGLSETRWLVVKQALTQAAIGIVIGLVITAFTVRQLQSMLVGVQALDPASFTIVPIALLLASVAASYWPARRATRIDPINALRSE